MQLAAPSGKEALDLQQIIFSVCCTYFKQGMAMEVCSVWVAKGVFWQYYSADDSRLSKRIFLHCKTFFLYFEYAVHVQIV
jgi:hypothetical protein